MTVRLLDVRVWNHAEQPGHSVYVRGPFPRRIWRCARHDCDWSHHETTGVTLGEQEATPPEPPMDPLSVIRRAVDAWRWTLITSSDLISTVVAAAEQDATPPEPRDEWRVVDDEGLVCCTEIDDLDDAHATAEMLDRGNPPDRHHVERAVVTWERVPARWSAPYVPEDDWMADEEGT